MDVHGRSTCIGHEGKNYLSRHRHHHPALLSTDRRRQRSAGGRHCLILREWVGGRVSAPKFGVLEAAEERGFLVRRGGRVGYASASVTPKSGHDCADACTRAHDDGAQKTGALGETEAMPKGKVIWSVKAREDAGFQGMEHFFQRPPPPPQVGRPAGVPSKKRGRPRAAPLDSFICIHQ